MPKIYGYETDQHSSTTNSVGLAHEHGARSCSPNLLCTMAGSIDWKWQW